MKTATFFDTLADTFPPETLERVGQFVLDVEDVLKHQVRSSVDFVEAIGDLTRSGGGKRLRPALVYLSACATGRPFDRDRTVNLGACMEMIHMATLIHDDVIDDAATRRGKPTAFSVYGNTASILGGDVLLAKAMGLLAEDGDLAIIRMTSQAVVELAEGEVRELELRGQFRVSLEDHLAVLRKKTASFIECCCRTGALAAGADLPAQESLAKFGHHIGLAFQIADDILDYRGEQSRTGKPLATDFREGQATLPLIHLVPLLSEEEQAFTDHKFGNGVSEDDLKMIIGWMDQRGSFRQSDADAEAHVLAALASLDTLPETPERELLRSVADYVVHRES